MCIRDSRKLPRDIGKERPCLNYHIHQCQAPCQGYVTKEEYAKNIRKVMDFLNGNYKEIITELESKMQQASDEMNFEKAIEYRELLGSVRAVAPVSYTHLDVYKRQEIPAYLIFSPVFFASIGMKTNLDGLNGSMILFSIILLVIAILSKVVGCGLGAKICKCTNKEALRIGVGMISRGAVSYTHLNDLQ